ncbi:YezD family protein [Salsuginibacillus kocurii]|nr:YezD family protein [Salsuginibacillus kocurii]
MGEKSEELERIKERLAEQLEGLQYGSITITVQDGKVVQMERSEKVRFK